MSEPNISTESPCIWCAGSLTLCPRERDGRGTVSGPHSHSIMDPEHPNPCPQCGPWAEQERTVSLDELAKWVRSKREVASEATATYGDHATGFYDALGIVLAEIERVRAALAQRDREETAGE